MLCVCSLNGMQKISNNKLQLAIMNSKEAVDFFFLFSYCQFTVILNKLDSVGSNTTVCVESFLCKKYSCNNYGSLFFCVTKKFRELCNITVWSNFREFCNITVWSNIAVWSKSSFSLLCKSITCRLQYFSPTKFWKVGSP